MYADFKFDGIPQIQEPKYITVLILFVGKDGII